MDALVVELQHAALSREKGIADLLRLAYAAAVKLGVADAALWLERELNGYPASVPGRELPAYRLVAGQVKGRAGPTGAWKAIVFNDAAAGERLSKLPLNNAAPELEALIAHLGRRHEDGALGVRYPGAQEAAIRQAVRADLDIQLHFTRSAVVRILDALRTNLLKWALELERAGVQGEGMRFTDEERGRAQGVRLAGVLAFAGGVPAEEIRDVAAEPSEAKAPSKPAAARRPRARKRH
ncbi:MAG: hypothetical protein HY521_02370 [Proteobacteria bacterium]|nr:hypothetical protein [Pseudomonadota bacterium]